MSLRLWHGGAPDLRPGDLIQPGHDRLAHYGCPWCEAREQQAAGGPTPAIDPLAEQADRVYLTSSREYARHYASLWGRGDLYRVEADAEFDQHAWDLIDEQQSGPIADAEARNWAERGAA